MQINPADCTFHIQNHAIERYRERLHKDHLSIKRAKEEIRTLLSFATVSDQKPEWFRNPPAWVVQELNREKHKLYIVVQDSILFPAIREKSGDIRVLSCIPKGSVSPQAREKRNEKRRNERARRGAGLRRWRNK